MSEGAAIERWAALVLLVTSLVASTWLRWQAEAVAEQTNAREQQLEHLAGLMAQRDRGAGASLAAFDGLFPGHCVVWQQIAAGSVLALRPLLDEVRR